MSKIMDPEESLSKIKSQLILSYMFWATLILKLPTSFDENMQPPMPGCMATAKTDGESIIIHPEYWTSLSSEDQKLLLVHEVAHCMFKHHLRRGDRDPMMWNIACDLVVNLILEEAGFRIPNGQLIDYKYKDMSAEAVYELIKKMSDKMQQQLIGPNGKGSWQFGTVSDFPGNGSEAQVNDHEWSARTEQAARAAKNCGEGSNFMDRFCEANKESKIPWKEVCQRFVQVKARNEYEWKHPNKRMIVHNMIAPSLSNLEIGKILFIGDSSGSIGEEEINICASEIQSAALSVKADFWVMWVDDHFQGPPTQIDPWQYPLKLKPKGGGGTCFKPGFNWIEKNDFDPLCVVYITDGYCSSFPKEPDFPVLWVVTAKNNFKPPFGEVTYWWN
jgi:predicted metal-dependent peptidase